MKVAAAAFHFREDVVGGAVQDAVNGREVLAREALAHGVEQRRPTHHAGFNSQMRARDAGPLGEFDAVFRHQMLVGGDEMLARFERRQRYLARVRNPTNQFHDDIDFRVGHHPLPVGDHFHGAGQPGEILLQDIADRLQLHPAAQPPLDFVLVLEQNLGRAAPHRPEADDGHTNDAPVRGGELDPISHQLFCPSLAHWNPCIRQEKSAHLISIETPRLARKTRG